MSASDIPLCLDLIGTLTPVNPQHERILCALKRTTLDVGSLPFRTELLHWLQEQRAAGRRLILLADGEVALAAQVGSNLGLFDETLSLEGTGSAPERKRRVLVERYGERRFDYIGSDVADLPVWEAANAAVVVGSPQLADQVGSKTQVLRVFAKPRTTLRTWIKAIRLHQWVKNALIFLPALLAHQMASPGIMLRSLLAFISFGCCASSVYIFNDLLDLTADRQHPRKRKRPFAAGILSVPSGIAVATVLLLSAVALAVVVGPLYSLVLAGYYLLTWAYSLRLKRTPLLDVMILAGLYTVRIIAGAAATRIEPSFWLLALSVFMFLSLGCVKRYAELDDARKAGKLLGHSRGYGADDLPLILSLGVAAAYSAIVVIALYINSADSLTLYKHHKTLWLICPLLLYWISRVWMLTARGHMHDDPVVFALRDPVSFGILGALGLIVYLAV
jgi:4-hydroxybenzoate polyprenyltransferase